MTVRPLLRRLRGDRRGVTLVEFALITPVMMVMMMGLFDIVYQIYAQSVLNGAIQKAGRDSTIQGASATTATIDQKVMSMVKLIANGATYTSSRKTYSTFSSIKPEDFTDSNGNGIRDPGECFTDINGNGQWDQDPGISGQGGANDVTVYTITITYPRLVPTFGLLGWSPNQSITASTVLKNQPYATQSSGSAVTICT